MVFFRQPRRKRLRGFWCLGGGYCIQFHEHLLQIRVAITHQLVLDGRFCFSLA